MRVCRGFVMPSFLYHRAFRDWSGVGALQDATESGHMVN